MTDADIWSHIDHTMLKATATWEDIRKVCDETVWFKAASVCIPPSYVARTAKAYGSGLVIGTVVGFPLGYSTTAAKAEEVRIALDNGATELDMVIDLGAVTNGDFSGVTGEIEVIRITAGSSVLKVIVETGYLDEREKLELCRCVTAGGADFIKTSTGFGTSGATRDDVILFRNHVGPNVKIKAAGGIRSREDMVDFLELGCGRLGTSSAMSVLSGGETGNR